MPTLDAFVEHFHVAVTVFIENAIGQTGQVMGAGSIERDRPITGNIFDEILEIRERRGHRAKYMRFLELFVRAHIDDHRLGAGLYLFD